MRFYFRKEGILFYGLSFAFFVIFLFLNYFFAFLFFILTLFFLYFFRDPEREIPKEGVVSPADGRVIKVEEKERELKVSIFMSPFNVHINRAPISGKITKIEYKKGKKYPADSEKSSDLNESNTFYIENEKYNLRVKQIAGILARRIVSFKKEGDTVQKGERIGLIKFGSRVEVFLSGSFNLLISKGDKVYAGYTIIAKEKET
ncbi:MAG: phosphatidylserine decarboxylase [Thermoanaerobaculia bacterium]